MAIPYSSQLQCEYQRLFDTCTINEDRYSEIDTYIKQIIKGQSRYETLSASLGVPWYFIGIIHFIEAGLDFKTHLYNGDSLNGRTQNIPVGYPKEGRPPFTWEYSAEDALRYDKLDRWEDWSVPGLLFKMESFSGYAEHNKNANSPYLWNYSIHVDKTNGNDDKRDKIAEENYTRCGAGVLLRRMAEKRLVIIDNTLEMRARLIRQLGDEIIYMPNRALAKVQELQKLLNLNGAHLRQDGRAGKSTSEAYLQITGYTLTEDPQEAN